MITAQSKPAHRFNGEHRRYRIDAIPPYFCNLSQCVLRHSHSCSGKFINQNCCIGIVDAYSGVLTGFAGCCAIRARLSVPAVHRGARCLSTTREASLRMHARLIYSVLVRAASCIGCRPVNIAVSTSPVYVAVARISGLHAAEEAQAWSGQVVSLCRLNCAHTHGFS